MDKVNVYNFSMSYFPRELNKLSRILATFQIGLLVLNVQYLEQNIFLTHLAIVLSSTFACRFPGAENLISVPT